MRPAPTSSVTIDLTLSGSSDVEGASSDIEIIQSPPIIAAKRTKGKERARDLTRSPTKSPVKRRRAVDLEIWDSDEYDDVQIFPAVPFASTSRAVYVDYDSEDERLARRLAAEEEASRLSNCPPLNPEDERLAQKLADEEQANFDRLVENVESRQEGIIFKVTVNAADSTLEDGNPAHPDDLDRFEPWKKKFEASGVKVIKFHWIVNYELEKRFDEAAKSLERIMGKKPEEIELFHGTSAGNVDSILKGGFRVGGMNGHQVTNGAALGYGIYMATVPQTSMGYAVGTNRIFACRVVPGRITTSTANTMSVPPSVDLGHENFESYGMGGIYVIRYACLVLPCYMIEYETYLRGGIVPPPALPPIGPIRPIGLNPSNVLPNPGMTYNQLKANLAGWQPLPLAGNPAGAQANGQANETRRKPRATRKTTSRTPARPAGTSSRKKGRTKK